MNKKIERRLVDAERRLNPPSAEPLVIIIRGGLNKDDPTFASAGELRWNRAPAESFAEFRARAMAVSMAVGKPFVVFGGLPEEALNGAVAAVNDAGEQTSAAYSLQ